MPTNWKQRAREEKRLREIAEERVAALEVAIETQRAIAGDAHAEIDRLQARIGRAHAAGWNELAASLIPERRCDDLAAHAGHSWTDGPQMYHCSGEPMTLLGPLEGLYAKGFERPQDVVTQAEHELRNGRSEISTLRESLELMREQRDEARAHADTLRGERNDARNEAEAWQTTADEAASELERLRTLIEQIALGSPERLQTEESYLLERGWTLNHDDPFPWKCGTLEASDAAAAMVEQRRIEAQFSAREAARWPRLAAPGEPPLFRIRIPSKIELRYSNAQWESYTVVGFGYASESGLTALDLEPLS